MGFSGWQKVRGLSAGAITATFLIIAIYTLPSILDYARNPASDVSALQVQNLILLLAMYGFPMAIFAVFTVGLVIWAIAERKDEITYIAAAKYGLITGIAIWFIGFIIGLLMGLITYLDPNSSYNVGPSGNEFIIDGLPTLRGLIQELQQLCLDALTGFIAGLATRFAAGKPEKANQTIPHGSRISQ